MIRKITFPYYRVGKGENLKIISQKFGIDSTKILLDNNLSPKQIKEGIFILIKKDWDWKIILRIFIYLYFLFFFV